MTSTGIFVVDLMLVMIFWVLVALLKGGISIRSVRGAGLECLVTTIGRNLVLLFLLGFVVVGVVIAVVVTLLLVVLMMIRLVTSATAAVTRVTLFHDTMDFLLVTLLEGVMKLAFCTMLNLTHAFLRKGAIGNLQVENVLEVFCDRLKCLIAKASSAFNIFCIILRVERHVEPLEL